MTKVFAVVVTYNPDNGLLNRLKALRCQVSAVLVVDNGSSNAQLVREIARRAECLCTLNEKNMGVAEALNQGALAAIENAAEWLATFDQDSLISPNAIAKLLSLETVIPDPALVAILAMSHSDRGTGRDYHRSGEVLNETDRWRLVRTTITSGSLIRISAFQKVGFFDSALFIDTVDLDFCLRCRRAELMIIESREVTLAHSMGDSVIHKVWGLSIVLTQHSPLRRYYITRNQLETSRRFALTDPRWALGALWDLAAGTATTLLFEAERAANLRAVLSGMKDFALRRFGERRESANVDR